MPKYSQTLTANAYTVQDASTRLKEAMDNLGWGTGKVDITGGYRYTATEETNIDSNPLVVSGANFIDGVQGKNVVYPSVGKRTFSALPMYLPGVKAFRIRFTPKRLNGGTSPINWITGENDNANTCKIAAYWLASGNPTEDSGQSNNLDYNARSMVLFSGASTPGTQVVSSWSNDFIVGYPTITFSINDPDVYIEIDAIEYTVDQNRFAFQSPNLDSPTFEVYSRTLSGNLFTTLVSLPIKNSKVPMVRLGTYPVLHNMYIRNPVVFDAHASVLYNTHPDSSIVGFQSQRAVAETLIWAAYNQDVSIVAGSNSTFDGFYLQTRQGTNWNGTTWDTVNKSTAFPNTTPQYPAVRKTRVSTPDSGANTYYPYGSSSSTNWTTTPTGGHHLFEVKNVSTIAEIQASQNATRTSTVGDDGYFSKVTLSLAKVEKQNSGSYKVTSVVKTGDALAKFTSGTTNLWRLPVNVEIQPGMYLVTAASDRFRNWYDDGNYVSTYFDFTTEASKSRDINYVGFFPKVVTSPTVVNGVRYIRDNLRGSNLNNDSHWVEVQAMKDGTNVALGKPVTGSQSIGNYSSSVITDGNSSNADYWAGFNNTGFIQIDLGATVQLDSIKIWHYYNDGRSYNSTLEVSENGFDWATIFIGSYVETSAGKTTTLTYPFTSLTTGVLKNANSITVGNETSTSIEGAMVVNPNLRVRVVQSNSGTPVNLRTLFAENWFSHGRLGVFGPYSLRLNRPDRGFGVTNGSWNYYDNIATVRFPFGLDVQMLNWCMEEYIASPTPSSVFRTANNLADYNNTQSIEFGKSPSKFADSRPYRRVWFSSIWGTSLQANNLFLLNGLTAQNTSYVTSQDNREYVTVQGVADNGSAKQSLAFRLR